MPVSISLLASSLSSPVRAASWVALPKHKVKPRTGSQHASYLDEEELTAALTLHVPYVRPLLTAALQVYLPPCSGPGPSGYPLGEQTPPSASCMYFTFPSWPALFSTSCFLPLGLQSAPSGVGSSHQSHQEPKSNRYSQHLTPRTVDSLPSSHAVSLCPLPHPPTRSRPGEFFRSTVAAAVCIYLAMYTCLPRLGIHLAPTPNVPMMSLPSFASSPLKVLPGSCGLSTHLQTHREPIKS